MQATFEISELLYAIRLAHGLNQIQFAKEIGTSQSSISKYETGKFASVITAQDLINVANRFNIELNQFQRGFLTLPINNKLKGINKKYLEDGSYEASEVFEALELIRNNIDEEVYNKLKIKRCIFSISNLKLNDLIFNEIQKFYPEDVIKNSNIKFLS